MMAITTSNSIKVKRMAAELTTSYALYFTLTPPLGYGASEAGNTEELRESLSASVLAMEASRAIVSSGIQR